MWRVPGCSGDLLAANSRPPLKRHREEAESRRGDLKRDALLRIEIAMGVILPRNDNLKNFAHFAVKVSSEGVRDYFSPENNLRHRTMRRSPHRGRMVSI
jgi:hypothetical protein